jgi:hypothetical protein
MQRGQLLVLYLLLHLPNGSKQSDTKANQVKPRQTKRNGRHTKQNKGTTNERQKRSYRRRIVTTPWIPVVAVGLLLLLHLPNGSKQSDTKANKVKPRQTKRNGRHNKRTQKTLLPPPDCNYSADPSSCRRIVVAAASAKRKQTKRNKSTQSETMANKAKWKAN